MVQVILQLAERVEKRIAAEMQGTGGSLLYDGWTSNDVHYIAAIGS